MTEKIGYVLLDTSKNTGSNEETDTSTYEELLGIAKTCDASGYDSIVSERKNWPVMYHFSGVRGNIISWYPGIKGKRVLEIGSECGALTSVMAEAAESVTCVEASYEKSVINAWRMREHKNVEIHVGDFADVEADLACDYDVITLIGLSGSEAPELLRAAARHLAPGGEVIAAVRNRLGMKYFAGCGDDDTGKYYDGIEGYGGTQGGKSLSKRELEDVCREAGFGRMDFYYPYPDYKFPMSVYSDSRLPKTGELRSNIVNFDMKRLVLFDEAKAYDSLAETDMFPLFSNSFLVILGKDGAPSGENKENILFSKFSNERAAHLSIRTDIAESAGVKYVRKAPCSAAASAHTGGLENRYKALEKLYGGTRFAPNRMRTEDGAGIFAFIAGESLEEILDRKYSESFEAFQETLSDFMSEINKTADCSFRQTEEFREVFGDARGLEGTAASHVGNIDMVAENIIPVSGAEWAVIDYEWTFLVPVPVNYIKWRAVHYYIEGNTKRFGLKAAGLFEKAGISAAEEEIFASMEEHFQKYIAGEHVPLRELYQYISEGAVDLAQMIKKVYGSFGKTAQAKICLDRGSGFDEQEAQTVTYLKDGVLTLRQPLSGIRAVRICPSPYSGCLTVDEMGTELGPIDIDTITSDGARLDMHRWLFDSDGPHITVSRWPKDSRYLYASMRMEYLEEHSAAFLRRELDERDRKI
ncbi:MAG: class I SAM-dependent methyltransferase, partial [Lachnospiraceae bacterium]|nr:class I SAM-dependent methyltransferase [Lachnospiraceae bacterium]